MGKRPFFSVIVPEHDAAEFMRRGLDSIIGQEFKDYELIIVCDRCSDNTEQIAEEYLRWPEGYDDRIIKTDFGAGGMARNAGLDVATGEWILFMDDDDWYLPGAFGILAEELKHLTDVDILAYGFEWKGKGVGMQSARRVYPAVWNKAWRRAFIGKERFPDWFHTDDLGFARKMHPIARFAYLNAVLYHYEFMRPGSISDRIRKGEYDNNKLPEEVRPAAEGYEAWLKREF